MEDEMSNSFVDAEGYVLVSIDRENPYYSMAQHGYIKEHRLVMARSLGRCLFSDEIVHHIDHNKQNNHLSNLQLKESSSSHMRGYEEQHICLDGTTQKTFGCYINIPLEHPFIKTKRSWTRIGTYCPYCGYIPNQRFIPRSQGEKGGRR